MTLRCPACRTRRSTFKLMQQHVQISAHALCGCGGYHYSHRPGSPFCELNPLAELRHAMRAVGGDEEMVQEILIEWALGQPGVPHNPEQPCPF